MNKFAHSWENSVIQERERNKQNFQERKKRKIGVLESKICNNILFFHTFFFFLLCFAQIKCAKLKAHSI